ncbi:MAG: type I DNA topoisomerase [Bacteroidetes bacterium]|nr:type I DNA topoisomerase [Bacteroidota bacterium]MCW5897379.1 type I DNA topoisomerase [Bacteroidota bacterium]
MAKRKAAVPSNGEVQVEEKKKKTVRARAKKAQPEPEAGTSLIIVESPSKAKTINKYLGKNYFVEASVGHIKNLPKSKLGVDVENGFALSYETIKGKDEVLVKLRQHAAKASTIYLATDPDREGEAIAWHLAKEIEDVNTNVYRVLFHEITERGITEAMENPSKINKRLVDSQQARRAMDRLVGYKVTPFLWKTMFFGVLSAGRVQSVAVRLVCEREEAIRSFIPEEYWSIVGEFEVQGSDPFLAKLFKVAGADPKIGDTKTAEGYVNDINKQKYRIADVQRKPVKRNPPAPFITSTLQQEAARRLRFNAKRTMMLAQKLYEGQDLGDEGRVGLITYMRTDSTRLSDDAVRDVREFIFSNYGKEYVPETPRQFKKGKSSQDAHEAIRPTSIKYTPKFVKRFLDKDMYELYELIWNRFVACQMNPAVFEQTTVDVAGGDYLFRATDSIPKFRGFLQVYDDIVDESEKDTESDQDPKSKLPDNLKQEDKASLTNILPNQHFTKPPGRYTDSSLIRELEALGIGRPSTYAMIVDTIQARKYVESKERRLYPTELGMTVNRILTRSFPHLFNVEFTAKMEDELETVATGEQSYQQAMEDFYHPFMDDLAAVDKTAGDIKKSLQESTDELCEVCGKPMIIKWGRNGRFMACSGYPKCKTTKPLKEDQDALKHAVGVKCDVCGADMVVKGGKFGAFLGCSQYPTCTSTRPIGIGVKCPKCKEGDVIERKTKRKRSFFGCSKYPNCDFASWDRPVLRPCDTCGNPYMVQKFTQTRGDFLLCPACKAEVAKEEVSEEVAG